MNTTTRPADTGSEPDPTESATAHPRKPNKKLFLAGMIFPLFMMVAMPLLYSWGLHSPSPHDMNVAVIGDTSQSQQLAGALDTKADGKFSVTTVADTNAAREALERLEIRGAWNPANGDVYIASSGSAIAGSTARAFLTSVAEAQDPSVPVNVIDIAPPGDNDRLANSLLFVGLAAVLGGFASASVLRMAVGSLSLRVELLLLTVLSAVTSVIPLFIAYSVYGAFETGFEKAFLLLFVGSLTVGCFHLGALRLIGPVAIIPTIVIMVLVGIPASGAAIPAEMVPTFFGMLSRILPTPALLEGLKRIVYFPEAGLGASVSTLFVWALLGMAMIGLAALRHTNDPNVDTRHERGFRHYFGDNHTATPPQMNRRKQLAGAVVMPVFMAIALPLLFIGVFHAPEPENMKVAIIGDRTVAEQTIGQIQPVTGESFDFESMEDAGTARHELERLEIRGAYDPSTGTLMVAHAGNPQAAMVVEDVFSGVATQSGMQMHVEDIAPLPTSDLIGAGVLYLGIGAILGGYLSAVVGYMLGNGIGMRWQVGAVVVVSAITAVTQSLISYQWLGILHNNEVAVTGLLFLIALTAGLFQFGGSLIIGPAMLLVSLLVLIFLGVTTSGIGVGMDMATPFYRVLHPILPTSNGFEGLKRIAYFDGANLGTNVAVLCTWLGASALLVVVGILRQRSGRGPKPPVINMTSE